jgi:hypothetical protein
MLASFLKVNGNGWRWIVLCIILIHLLQCFCWHFRGCQRITLLSNDFISFSFQILQFLLQALLSGAYFSFLVTPRAPSYSPKPFFLIFPKIALPHILYLQASILAIGHALENCNFSLFWSEVAKLAFYIFFSSNCHSQLTGEEGSWSCSHSAFVRQCRL